MTSPTSNPHRVPTQITGVALIATIIGALYGASTQPEHAEWSAFAVAAAIAVYLYNKARKVAYDRRASKAAVAA